MGQQAGCAAGPGSPRSPRSPPALAPLHGGTELKSRPSQWSRTGDPAVPVWAPAPPEGLQRKPEDLQQMAFFFKKSAV